MRNNFKRRSPKVDVCTLVSPIKIYVYLESQFIYKCCEDNEILMDQFFPNHKDKIFIIKIQFLLTNGIHYREERL